MTRLLRLAAIVGFAFLLSPMARAEEPKQKAEDPCMYVYQVALSAMTARQNSVPMPEAMANAGDDELARILVRAAYEAPVGYSEEHREGLAKEFANRWYAQCWDTENKREDSDENSDQ